jgi:GNAT superfamily N-acetyltransferase
MATATDAAIDTIRTAVTQANSTDSDDFAEFMTGKAGASAMARLRDRVGPLRALQAELLQAIDAQCGPAAGRSAMIAAARASGFTRLSLETGTQEMFTPARRLYEKAGFTECPPFEGYMLDPNSHYMTRDLA